MKIAILQGSNSGFYPRFYRSLKDAADENGYTTKAFSPQTKVNYHNALPSQIIWGYRLNWHVHHALFQFTGKQDCFSWLSTLDLIRKLKVFDPDVIHLHVILQWQINLPMFVRYVNKNHIPVVWTFHDCRAFTGGCPYFDEIGCEKWKLGCGNCPAMGGYITSRVDKTDWVWQYRKKWISSIEKLAIVTPSRWLAEFVSESFLKDKTCHVIYNGVDIDIFSKPSSFNIHTAYNISPDKKILLGCAIGWSDRKGLNFFIELAKLFALNGKTKYQIVIVGTITEEKNKELSSLGIICTGRTKSFEEMVALYQAASVFVNPTLADNFPTTNIEALAAGTPVITFKTGGSPEAVGEHTGIVVEQGNVKELAKAIETIVDNSQQYSSGKCHARSSLFSNDNYNKYIELYRKICAS